MASRTLRHSRSAALARSKRLQSPAVGDGASASRKAALAALNGGGIGGGSALAVSAAAGGGRRSRASRGGRGLGASTTLVGGGATGSAASGTRKFRTFTESLELNSHYMDEFVAGNFLYLRPKRGMDRTAYDLETCEHWETDPNDYYTMSKAGITHFVGNDSEFTSLEQWEREYSLFTLIRNIPFFAKYRSWKNFTVWKKNVRAEASGKCSAMLDSGLFFLNPTLRVSLMRLRRLCFEVSRWRLFEVDTEKTYTLDEFCEEQAVKRHHVTTWLAHFTDDVRALVRGACDEVLDKFLADNSIQADHKMTFMERAALRTECRKLTKYIRLADFLVTDTLLGLALDSTAALDAVVRPALKPARVVRIEKEDDSAANSRRVMTKKDAAAVAALPLFRVEVNFEARSQAEVERRAKARRARAKAREEARAKAAEAKEALGEDGEGKVGGEADEGEEETKGTDGEAVPGGVDLDGVADAVVDEEDEEDDAVLTVSPTMEEVRSRIKTLLLEAMTVVSAPPLLLTHEDLSPYTQAATEDTEDAAREEVDLAEVVMADPHFVETSEHMFEGLELAFEDVADFCRVFQPFKNTYMRNQDEMVDVESHFRAVDLEAFEAAITKYRGQSKDFNTIPFSADIGIIRVDSERLKTFLMPSPARCLYAIQELLPRLIKERSEGLLNEVSELNRIVGGLPTTVEAFVEKVACLNKTTELLPQLRERKVQVNQMGSIMVSNEWAIPDQLKALFMMVGDALTSLEQAAALSESKLDDDTKRFAHEVEEQVPVLKKKMLSLREKLEDKMIADADADVATVLTFLDKRNAEMDELKDTADKLQHYQAMLKQPVQDFDTLEEVVMDLRLKTNLWRGLKEWTALQDGWVNAPFENIDAEAISVQVAKYVKTAVRASRGLPGNQAAPRLKGMVDKFKLLLPVVNDLRNDSLQPRHWQEIEEIIDHEFDKEHTYTLGELLDLKVVNHQQDISVVATKAVSEAALLGLFQKKVLDIWVTMEFIVNPHKESKEVFILGSVEDIVAALDDSLVTLNTILGSRYCAPIRDDVENWQRKLNLLSDTLDEWLLCQKQWMYLETIFSAADIQRQLPDENRRFVGVDKSWKAIMKRTNTNPNCIAAGTVKNMKETLQRHNETLDQIQKSLEDYLETKRSAFPRFYFLSNDELLEILAQTRDPQAVQPHLRKCFDAINRLKFGAEAKSVDILAMISPEKEEIALGRNLKARGNVEDWLMNVQRNMKDALHKLLKAGVINYDEVPRQDWVLAHPGQVVATGAQIMWSRNTEKALRSENPVESMKAWLAQNVEQLSHLTELVRSNLSKIQRKVIVALVTTDVHARDIIEILVDDRVDNIGNFTWQQQLRYYWDKEEDTCLVRQSNCLIRFGYEYQGCTSRLVITPLTDRCWMTITGAVHLKLGANPAGPAGTGKTESSKDLAKAIAVQCIVFNCSDQIDYIMVGKLLSGLAQAACWTCLDEFNRIDIEVLSVVAQQLLQLRQGLLAGVSDMEFEGRHIKLNPHTVIVTMNPGYAGRTELPDNLKILFRPVAMMVPDYALIAEIILFAEGFDDARNLSRKMTRLYRLSSEQLSQQRHYDFGMRAVKSVLVMAGALKRGNPGLSEDVVLIRAMRDSNVPKFLSDDLPLFHAIVGDLFPGVVVPSSETGQLQQTIADEVVKAGLQLVDKWQAKILQLFETFNVRFGVVLTGPTTGGKTSCYKVLQNAMTTLREQGVTDEKFQIVRTNVLNPKCISMGELYGEFNELTQEWTDGLASTLIRAAVADETEDKKWTVFDGPIDALWIENMNTVLDDNMTLCLANGERIKLKTQMRMLFEVMDLEVASPATVSRLGVVYMTPTDLGWEPYVKSWLPASEHLKAAPQAVKDRLLELFLSSVGDGVTFVRKHLREPIKTVATQQATSVCGLVDALLAQNKEAWQRPEDDAVKMIENLFAFAYVWGIGGSLAQDSFERFDNFMRNHSAFDRVRFGHGQVFDVYYNAESGEFQPWTTIVPKFEYSSALPYTKLFVPTVDTVRFAYVLKAQLELLHPVFFTGVTGTGKTVIVQNLIEEASDLSYDRGTRMTPILITFSAQSSAIDTQGMIENNLQKKRKTLLGAPTGTQVTIFVDDVNMPAVEEYGAQPPIELLRQFVDHAGFYDRQRLFWKDIESSVLCCGAAPPGGGRNDLTPRFSRHFHIMCVPPATDQVLTTIFGSILGGFLQAFTKDCQSLVQSIADATVDIYNRMCETMKPTPAKSHYTFNLRDVSKVFQGVLMVRPKEAQSGDKLIRLWIHEAMRVFYDRLVSFEDKEWFTNLVCELLSRRFMKSGGDWSHEALFENRPIIWVDFLRPRMDDGPGTYEESLDMDKLVNILNDALYDYNVTNPTQMKLVFFRDAVEHVSRITRILRQPRGNAMLVGVGGSGKQSLTRMACAIEEIPCNQIELTRGYGIIEFRDDVKANMMKAGLEGTGVCFLMTDTQIVDERFLEDINNILNTGEVPGLWENDELTKIADELRPVCQQMGIPETRDNLYRLFVQRVRDNMHITLAMSPVGDSLRVRCRMFPSLINCTTIDWYLPWPEDALTSVANRFLAEENLGTDEVKTALAKMCVHIHRSIDVSSNQFFDELRRKVYTTPKSYLDLINLYLSMLSEKRTELSALAGRLAVGVGKLEETNEMVAGLKEELRKLQPVLDAKTEETTLLLERVRVDQEEASKVQARVQADEKVVRAQAAEVAEVQADAQRDLDVAMPALHNALKALDSLDKKDITEVKSFAKPPPAVQTVMEAVCILLGSKPDWDSSKRLLGNAQFMQNLKDYDKDNIPPKMVKQVQKYTKQEIMAVDNVKKVSKAATSLCMWVHAMVIYSKVAKEVEPKKQRLAAMNAELAGANATLKEKQDQLQAVLDKVATLKQKCDDTVAEKDRLNRETQLTKDRLDRAEKLTSGLADEQVRWKASVDGFNQRIANLVGDVLLSAGCISYFGAFTGKYRDRIVSEWLAHCLSLDVPTSENFSLMKTMGDPVTLRDWQINGLPTDSVSADSAILVTRGKRWPLMIDPQEQAKKWIYNMEAKAKLSTTRIDNPNMLRTLENCIRIGTPLLVEDIGEHLDPALEPVLARAVFKQGGRLLIRLGDSDVDYDPTFRMYISTKLPNPHYLPEVCIKVTVINFTVTQLGLEDQLLGAVVKKERPDIEVKKNRLVVSMAADKKQLQELEDRILKLLSESKGNILDDVELIAALGESKQLSGVITERLKESERTELEINEMRNQYTPVAVRGALIYFVVANLALIDPMYQYSLAYFTRLYNICIDDSEKSDDLPTRLENLIDYLTAFVYGNVCRGLFEEHKLLFSFLISISILRAESVVSTTEWMTLLRGAGMTVNAAKCPFEDVMPPACWNLLQALEEDMPEFFEGILEDVLADPGRWRAWMEGGPHKLPLPEPWNERLNPMQRMLMVKVFKEEKVMFAVRGFVRQYLGDRFVENAGVSMAEVVEDTDFATPLVFILSVGADPTGLLLSYAKQRDYVSRLRIISLGQGQGPRAQAMIEEAFKTGDWVMLQNCHLAKSWMPELERICAQMQDYAKQAADGITSAVHPDFRLFLTSMPATYFPVPVLQNSVKLTNEPPKGIKANLTRSLANITSWTDFESCDGTFADETSKMQAWKKLSFGLCFFHAMVQERRKFGPLGWNITYEFNDSDLETSVQILKMFLTEQPRIPWDALTYVTGQINYGGRVTDDWDRRCLMTMLAKFFTTEILTEDYKFSASGIYYAPAEAPLEELRKYVHSLPLNDDPEIFGMHENANISFQYRETTSMLKTALSIQPRSGGGGDGKTPDEIASELAAKIESKLPEVLDREEAGKNTFVYRGEHMDSLATVLGQEMERFNKLLVEMANSLSGLQRAIKGEVLMDNVLDAMYTSLINNQVPANWEAVAYPSLKPLASWVVDLHARIAFLRQWLVHGQPGVFWMSGFFFPQGFMTGTLQNHARKYQVAIDTLTFGFDFYDIDSPEEVPADEVPEDGVLVNGLFLDGARWNKEKKIIDDSNPGEMYFPVRVCHATRPFLLLLFCLFFACFLCVCVLWFWFVLVCGWRCCACVCGVAAVVLHLRVCAFFHADVRSCCVLPCLLLLADAYHSLHPHPRLQA